MRIDLYNYKEHDFVCCSCGWKGKGFELPMGEVFMDSPIVELDCPKCFRVIGSGQGNIIDEEDFLKYETSKLNSRMKVFELGAEGGSIAIYSEHNNGNNIFTSWYYFEINEMGFEEEDIPPTHIKSEYSYTFWETMMRLKKDKPWFFRLYPLLVDKSFHSDIISVFRLLNDTQDFELDYGSWSRVLDITTEELRRLIITDCK